MPPFIRMDALLTSMASLSQKCAAVAVTRCSDTRNTHLKRKLAKLNLPLLSVLNRLRRGLVLCGEADLEQHARKILARFCLEAHVLTRSLENGARTAQIFALMHAIQEFERIGYIS